MLTKEELELGHRIGFDESVLLMLKQATKAELTQLMGTNPEIYELEDDEEIPLAGVSLALDESALDGALIQIRQNLPTGYISFIVENRNVRGSRLGDAIAVLKTTNQLEAVKVRATDGANYDISNEDILAKLKEWQQLCEFNIVRVGTDTVALEFTTLPTNICQFAEDVYEFCPDTVEQGVGVAYHPQKHAKIFAAARQLCPQLVGNYTDSEVDWEAMEEFGTPAQMEELKKLAEQYSQEEASLEDGIRLLAYDIHRTKQLFLWWD